MMNIPFVLLSKILMQMRSIDDLHHTTNILYQDQHDSYVPIKREDYQWLIDSSSS